MSNINTNIPCKKCKDGYFTIINIDNKAIMRCSNYPDCDSTRDIHTEDICPKCKSGKLRGRKGRYGKDFISCSRYPLCKYIHTSAPEEGICPKCKIGNLYCKEGKYGVFIKCSNSKCNYVRGATKEESDEYIKERDERREYMTDRELFNFLGECGPLMDGDDYIGFRD